MGEILTQLGRLFLESIPTIVFVFLLLAILNRLFFRPLTRILKQREDATVGALARAREQAVAVDEKTREYEAAFQAARQEVYRQREADRKAALRAREVKLGESRGEVEAYRQGAQAALQQEVEAVKRELQRDCRSLAQQITDTVLDVAPAATGRHA